MLANPDKYEEIDYGLFFDLKFIDEDGFILRTLHPYWYESKYTHEKYEQIDLRKFWHADSLDNVISKFLIMGKIEEDIINKTVKIVYEPCLDVIRSKTIENNKAIKE
jgi:hypothetical protein